MLVAKLLKKSSSFGLPLFLLEVGVLIYIYLMDMSRDFLEDDLSEFSEGFRINLLVL